MMSQKALKEQLAELCNEEDELSKIIISLSKYPVATEALLAAFSTTKEHLMEVLQDLRTIDAQNAMLKE